MEFEEFAQYKIESLITECQKYQITNIWHPIPDGGVTPNPEGFLQLVKFLKQQLQLGMNVVVHCRGGLGRSGTLFAALLISLG